MRSIFFIFIVLGGLFPRWIYSFNGTPSFAFQALSIEDGLSHGTVTSFVEDELGFMWIGTLDGLNLFDGQTIREIDFSYLGDQAPSSHITDLATSSDGLLYVATDKELYSFHRHFGDFKRISNSSHPLYVNNIHKDNRDRLWALSKSGQIFHIKSNRLEGLQVEHKDISREFLDIFQFNDTDKVVVVDVNGVLLFEDEGQAPKWIPLEDNTDKIHAACVQDSSRILINIARKGIYSLDLVSEKWEKLPLEMVSTNLNGLMYNDTLGLLGISFGKGLVHWENLDSKAYTLYQYEANSASSPSHNNHRTFYRDRKGKLWLGGSGNALNYQFDPKEKMSLWNDSSFPISLRSSNISAIYEDSEGSIWIGHRMESCEKLKRKKASYVQEYCDPRTYPKSVITFYEYQDIILAGLISGGVMVYDKKLDQWRDYLFRMNDLDDLKGQSIYQFKEGKRGELWIGSYVGLYQYSISNQKMSSPQKLSTIREAINAIAFDKEGRIWMASAKNGIKLWNPSTDTLISFAKEHKDSNKIPNNQIVSMLYSSDNTFWFGTYGGGVFRIDPKTLQITTPTSVQEMSRNFIYTILEDRNGDLWFSSNQGLIHYDRLEDQLNYIRDIPGIQGDEFNSRVGLVSNVDERLFFGGVNGINVFDISHAFDKQWRSPIYLFQQEYFEERGDSVVHKKEYGLQSLPLNLNYNHHQRGIELHFVYPNLRTINNGKLEYRLGPSMSEYVTIGKDNALFFSALSPGSYTLFLRFVGQNDEQAQKIRIVSKAPWWKTNYAYLMYGISAFLLLWFLYRVRIRQIKKYDDLRRKISSDLHDDVGGTLSGLAMQSELLAYELDGEQKQQMMDMASMNRRAMENMRDIVWAIDSKKDSYQDLIDRMRNYIERELGKSSFSFDFKVQDLELNKSIDPLARQQVYLIFKEIITNICKHSNGSHVHIELYTKNRRIYLEVTDNGVITQKRNTSGLGLNNMRWRASRINGEIKFNDEKGFQVILVFGK